MCYSLSKMYFCDPTKEGHTQVVWERDITKVMIQCVTLSNLDLYS